MIDSSSNEQIIDFINNEAIKNIKILTEKYNDNLFILNKINNYLNNLSINLENDNYNYIKKLEKNDRIMELSKEFIDNYINSNNYYYCSSSELYFKYDGLNYFTYRDDTILYEIATQLNRDDFLVNYKTRIKSSIIKEIKERNILESIPDTSTIQLVINNMLPLFLNNKIYVKYFLTILGDTIQKKNEHYTYLLYNNYKKFIRILSQLSYQYFGSNYFNNIKYGYHEIQKNCRIIYADKNLLENKYNNVIDNLITNLKCKNSNNFLDVLMVGVYYSNRYENSEKFLHGDDSENIIKKDIMLLDDINNLVKKFISTSLEKCNNEENDNIKINTRNMQYLWKLFLLENNLPNINFVNNFKLLLKQQIEYNQDNDIYIGVTSKKLPLVRNFLDFWNTSVIYNNNASYIIDNVNGNDFNTYFEISEIVLLFKHWIFVENKNNNYTISINENIVIDLISHYYENVVIDEEKYIYNISTILWNKNKDIIDFIKYYKNQYINTNKSKRSNININILYSNYCRWCKEFNKKFVVGKNYFNKFIINYFHDFIKDNNLNNALIIDINLST
tara:strand:- start:4469 stop:6148 length:1680 start_codon:yes stop_codon:yes gene_type:complete